MSNLVKIYTVGKFSYFCLWYLNLQEKFQERESDPAEKEEFQKKLTEKLSLEMSAFYISSRLLDDGVILPQETRQVKCTIYVPCCSVPALS